MNMVCCVHNLLVSQYYSGNKTTNVLQWKLDYPDPFEHGCLDMCPENWNRPDNKNQCTVIVARAINNIHV